MTYPEQFQGFAISDPKDWATPKLTSFQPKNFGPRDVDIEVECCGICASELFALKNDWTHEPLACLSSKYGPKTQVVGHEVVGKVVAVGPEVSLCKVGDRVGLGAQASACMQCSRCQSSNEQYCAQSIGTYCNPYPDGYVSQGGYASHVRAHEQFCFPIPPEIPSELVAPLQCGGLTVFSPIKRNIQGKKNPRVAIIGIGGLGHMAIMISKALGAEVSAVSRGYSKRDDALKMGADHFIATSEPNWNAGLDDTFDLILNCASSTSSLDLNALLPCLKVNCNFVSVGLPHIDEDFKVKPFSFFHNGCNIGSSKLGSREEAIELMQLAVKHNFRPWVETIKVSEAGVSEGLTRLDKGDVRYRFTLTGFHDFFGTGKQ
ncbi:NAD(P)-dependent alcohol dehydrogenase [Lachancea thermotolerans CBS 6340]|uniref:KLTH0E07964p n=1 Tax=Lachancea thermotolerans (strain ATCC 56472 / CBS 6340 / NRRL Y-8284) TaxID=559295 RepID=C5DHX8_LACTC|nr:KLTH0E07964p [Lachancea thermotolerans CBS 6340]CAR23389.1 KLTH0E07964p [Lachancea thermotolerans CBS 6340]